MEELVNSQPRDLFCSEILRKLKEWKNTAFYIDDTGLLVRTLQANPQLVIPHSLKERILVVSHYPALGGHPDGRRLYYRIKRYFYWPSLAADCYGTVRNCSICTRNRIKQRRNVGELKIFPASAPLESTCIDILGDLIKTPRDSRYLLVITDRFTKLVSTISLKGVSAAEIAKQFVNEWVFSYGPPTDLIADNGRQFTLRFFQDVCKIQNVHNSFATNYYPQTNGQVERSIEPYYQLGDPTSPNIPRHWDLYIYIVGIIHIFIDVMMFIGVRCGMKCVYSFWYCGKYY